MANLALNLSSVARDAKWSMNAGIIKLIIETSPWLNWMKVRSIQNMVHTFLQETKLPDTQTRLLGVPYAAQDIAIEGMGQVGLAIYGGAFGLDRQLADIPSIDGRSQVAKQIDAYFRATGLDLKKAFIKGNAGKSPGQADGMEQQISKSQTVDFDTTSGSTIAALTAEEVVELFETSINLCEGVPNIGLLDKTILSSLAAKSVQPGNEALREIFKYQKFTVIGPTGEPITQRMAVWDDTVALVPIGKDSQKVKILDYNEKSTDGVNSDCSSIYFFMGDTGVEILQKYDDGPRTYPKQGDVGTNYDIDYPLAFWMKFEEAASRLRNIRKPA